MFISANKYLLCDSLTAQFLFNYYFSNSPPSFQVCLAGSQHILNFNYFQSFVLIKIFHVDFYLLPFLIRELLDRLDSTSSQEPRNSFVTQRPTSFASIISNTELHRTCYHAMPDKIMKYKHVILLFNIYNEQIPAEDWTDLNFLTLLMMQAL